MTIVEQVMINLTLLLAFMGFIIIFIRLLKNKKRSLNYILDGVLAIGLSGIVFMILGSKAYQASLPTIIILVVLIVKFLKCHLDNEVKL